MAAGGYDERIREVAEGEAADMMDRLRSYIAENTEDLAVINDNSDTDSDDEGYADGAVIREEE